MQKQLVDTDTFTSAGCRHIYSRISHSLLEKRVEQTFRFDVFYILFHLLALTIFWRIRLQFTVNKCQLKFIYHSDFSF